MPLYLVAPGDRVKWRDGKPYPNRTFLVRGEVAGRDYEISTKTADPLAAQRFKAALELRLLTDCGVPAVDATVTFGRATELYLAFKDPSPGDRRRINRVAAAIGADKPIRDVQHADLVAAAELLFPAGSNEYRNRWAIKPGAAILHYAAENKWCEWKRIKRLKEKPPVTRAATDQVRDQLLAALVAEEREAKTKKRRVRARKKQLLVLWLFSHWNRISDPLRLTWPDLDLPQRRYEMLIGKANVRREKPLDDEIFEILANTPEAERTGRLFPWHHRSSVYNWLRPLCRRLGIEFTPHRARHYGGKRLNRDGAGIKTIMSALDHSDATSSLRYQDADVEIVREAMTRAKSLGKLPGKAS